MTARVQIQLSLDIQLLRRPGLPIAQIDEGAEAEFIERLLDWFGQAAAGAHHRSRPARTGCQDSPAF